MRCRLVVSQFEKYLPFIKGRGILPTRIVQIQRLNIVQFG